jgi:hypothetical protein
MSLLHLLLILAAVFGILVATRASKGKAPSNPSAPGFGSCPECWGTDIELESQKLNFIANGGHYKRLQMRDNNENLIGTVESDDFVQDYDSYEESTMYCNFCGTVWSTKRYGH